MNVLSLKSRFLELCRTADIADATAFQREIAGLIPGESKPGEIATVCGLDIAFDKSSPRVYAGAAVFKLPEVLPLEEKSLEDRIDFPYVPGLLAYREGPAIIELVSRLKTPVDLLLLDGQGIAHPRGAGFASMIGLLLNKRSIGCAKTRLVGTYREPGRERGASSDLVYRGNVVGQVLRTRSNVAPLYVSVGYEIELERATEIVLSLCRPWRIPIPIRRAHILANFYRQIAKKAETPAASAL
jgi:deoxyribonuclease V